MEQKIADDVAKEELERIVKFFELDPEGSDWEDSKTRLLSAIKKGRVTLNEENASVTMQLVSPIILDNKEVISSLSFREPTAGDLRVLDRYKESEKMTKTIALASNITGKPIAIIDRMGTRDVATMGAITTLFF